MSTTDKCHEEKEWKRRAGDSLIEWSENPFVRTSHGEQAGPAHVTVLSDVISL